MAVAGAWALTSGIGPLETARTALFIAPGGAESWPESSPEESLCDCGFAVQLEGVPGLARRMAHQTQTVRVLVSAYNSKNDTDDLRSSTRTSDSACPFSLN